MKTLDARNGEQRREWLAKQQETKARRLQEAIGLLAAGKKLGLK